MKLYIFLISLFFLSTSCVTNRKSDIRKVNENKKNIYYRIVEFKDGNNSLYRLSILDLVESQRARVKIEKDNSLNVDFVGTPDSIVRKVDILSTSDNEAFFKDTPDAKYIDVSKMDSKILSWIDKRKKELEEKPSKTKNDSTEIDIYKKILPQKKFQTNWIKGEKSKYRNIGLNGKWQVVTVPFKIRPELNESIPGQISTGINVGFTRSFKQTINTYQPVYNETGFKLDGYREKSYEWGFAPFLGLTSIELTEENTKGSVTVDRQTLGVSFGAFALGGINEFDVGVGVGIDYGFSKQSKDWNYQDRWWFGLMVGIDLVK